jgi:beta-glucosidase
VAEKKELLTDVLRGEWGYQGLVMTDWFGGNDAAAMIAAGNDLLEPGTNIQWKDLKDATENGTLTLEEIDTAAGRILQLILQSKKMQNYAYSNHPDLDGHAKIARKSATEGMVLLKNNNALPIKQNQTVALLGVTSFDFIAGGTGSGDVNEAYTVSLEDGLINAGFEINTTSREVFEKHKANFKEQFIKPQGLNAMTNPYFPPRITYSKTELEEIINDSDLGVITIGRNSGEGGDRVKVDDFMLSETEQNTIAQIGTAFHAADKKVVVVLNIGGVIETDSWKDQVDAILLAWQGGQEGGNSVADLLSGKVNPSGKLPMTFPIHLEDHASNANFPLDGGMMDFTKMLFGRNKQKPEDEKIKNKDFTKYQEGIYVGYRHFDKAGLDVSYPFGFGLSYTQFELSDLTVSLEKDYINLELKVINIGSTAGKEVVQVYSAKPDSSVDRPPYELKTFLKTPLLNPGDSTYLNMQIPLSDLSYWSEKESKWILEKGLYSIYTGTSSRALPLTADLEIN